jgi:hypothetical protein
LDRLLDHVAEPQSEVRLRRGARLIFTVAVFLTALLGFLSWHTARQAGEDADWVTHTHEISTRSKPCSDTRSNCKVVGVVSARPEARPSWVRICVSCNSW